MAMVLYELDRQFFPTPWSLESWEKLFLEHDRLLVVHVVDGDIFGFCLFDKMSEDFFAHLLKILVVPHARNRGLAKILMLKALSHLETLKYSHFFLEVDENNRSAIKLYSSFGFEVIHRKKDFYGANRSALIMSKK